MAKAITHMCVIGEFTVEEVHTRLLEGVGLLSYVLGDVTYTTGRHSIRYDTFRRSTRCVECGIVGTFYRLEYCRGSEPTRPHYNLYAENPNDPMAPIMMTRDHIIPQTYGGPDVLWNLQTMCRDSNMKKACSIPLSAPDIPENDREKFLKSFIKKSNLLDGLERHLTLVRTAMLFPELRENIHSIMKANGLEFVK